MRDCVHEEKYHGLTVKIYHDEDAQSPEEDGDDGLFLVGYHRDFTVDRGTRALVTIYPEAAFKDNERVYADGYGWKSYKEAKDAGLVNKQVRRGAYTPGISKGLAQCIANNGEYEDGSICEEAKDYLKKYHVFGLEAYIHSGVRLALSGEGRFPDRQWDVSQLGLVFASKKEWRLRKSARKAAEGHVAYWNDYLAGNVYGYVVEGPNGDVLDSCWGFYGDYEDGALSEGRSTAEYHYKEMLKKKARKTKAYIQNKVPLTAREA